MMAGSPARQGGLARPPGRASRQGARPHFARGGGSTGENHITLWHQLGLTHTLTYQGAALETEPQSDLLTLGSKPPKGEVIHKLEIRSGVALTLGECATVVR